jgi:hypothetical protein
MEARPLNQSTLPLTSTVSPTGTPFPASTPLARKKVSASLAGIVVKANTR